MNDKLENLTGRIKCPLCGHEFFKGLKGLDQKCPGCGGKFLLQEKDVMYP